MKIMINTLILNCVFVFLLVSFQMCLNCDKCEVSALEDTDDINKYSANSETYENIANREKSYHKIENSYKNESFIDLDYTIGTNMSEIWNDTDETCDENFLLSKFFTFTQDQQNDEIGDDCDNCFPGLLKEDTYTKSKENYKIENNNVRPRHDLAIKTKTKRQNGESEARNPYLRVVNGKPAKLGDVPYQVAFKAMISRARQEYFTFCGGTIIGPTKLISAAHCFEGAKKALCQKTGSRRATKRQLRQTRVVAGNLRNLAKLNDGGQWRRLLSMVYPLKYRFPKLDISVGFVTVAFTFNDHVNQIPYAKTHTEYDETICLVSGYGKINNRELSDKLLLAELVLRSTEYCTRIHHTNMKKFICTDSVPSDVEQGDSGGPLVCSGVLVGVVSGHRQNSGSFFTRVSSYSKYIARGLATSLTCNSFYVYFVSVFVNLYFII